MFRYCLSRVFANTVPQTDYKKHNRLHNLDHYRDEVLGSLKKLLAQEDITLEIMPLPFGDAHLRLNKGPIFRCRTEWGDFLLMTGREAALRFYGPDGISKVFYYGNSWAPDTAYPVESALRHQYQVAEMVPHFVEWVRNQKAPTRQP